MTDVDMEDPVSIWDQCVHGLDIPDNNDFHLHLFLNAVEEIASDMNCFD